jgi:hypothetical protein
VAPEVGGRREGSGVHAVDVERAGQVVGLVLDDAGWPRSSSAATVTARQRRTSAEKPATLRQPSKNSSVSSPAGATTGLMSTVNGRKSRPSSSRRAALIDSGAPPASSITTT